MDKNEIQKISDSLFEEFEEGTYWDFMDTLEFIDTGNSFFSISDLLSFDDMDYMNKLITDSGWGICSEYLLG